MRDNRSERGFAIAAIIQAVPPAFSYFVVIWMSLFMLVAIVLNFSNLPEFFARVLWWCSTALVILGILAGVSIGIWFHHQYHDIVMKVYERRGAKERAEKLRLQNEILLAKVEVHKQLPVVMKYAMDQNKNVTFGELKVEHYLSNIHMLPGDHTQQIAAPNIILPAKSQMIEVARRHDFSRDNLFLALAESGDITTTIGGYVHAANDGSTGSGKTTNWRGQLVQFIKAGVSCILLNPHFSLMTKAGDDWKPIAKGLSLQGGYGLDMPRVVTKFPNIGAVLAWLATVEIDRRFELLRQGCFDYQPLYAYIDEWPAIVTNCEDAPEHLRTILQRGRAVEVCVSVNSQGFLANDTDLRGSARENFDTAFWMGGSTYSGAKMLDMRETDLKEMIKACPENIGKGVGFLRNNSDCGTARIVRLPYADNGFVYHCLGYADDYQLPPETVTETVQEEKDLDVVHGAIIALKEMGEKVTVRAVADLVPFGKTKVSELMNKLEAQGCEIR